MSWLIRHVSTMQRMPILSDCMLSLLTSELSILWWWKAEDFIKSIPFGRRTNRLGHKRYQDRRVSTWWCCTSTKYRDFVTPLAFLATRNKITHHTTRGCFSILFLWWSIRPGGGPLLLQGPHKIKIHEVKRFYPLESVLIKSSQDDEV